MSIPLACSLYYYYDVDDDREVDIMELNVFCMYMFTIYVNVDRVLSIQEHVCRNKRCVRRSALNFKFLLVFFVFFFSAIILPGELNDFELL